jgi:hypothetical protein
MKKVKSLKESRLNEGASELLAQLTSLMQANPKLAALPLSAVGTWLGTTAGMALADKIAPLKKAHKIDPITKKEAYTLDNETTWTEPAEYKDGSMMPEKYVPLKDRPVPSSDELNAEWEKRKGGFKKSMANQVKGMKEDVNVKDSRTIKLTPTTKNKILTLVHEMAKKMKEGVAYKVDGEVTSFNTDAEAQDFKSKNSNIQTIKKL